MYFKEKGAENTTQCVAISVKTAAERNIRHIVVASGSGDTAKLFAGVGTVNVVCVTNAYGFKDPGRTKMTDAARDGLERAGIRVLATTHMLSGAERGISRKHGGISPVELMAETLRMLGQGVKVCVEIAVMALDAGMIPHGEEIIVVAGSGRGADTAVIMHPAHANNILETKINEILCKPRNF
ncbi:pyruvate kinase alpha/beta domain-containing protein [uncultured Desulfovibrio sp.]|uniref:pyruvate kinase alpha/beta domain-containing protein n=1 Tax=uncultured Desulfovibrio sp. TaxID=167968 RepID=UPI000399E89B|nr:pyruvate kinase alpha/beta domain-containing protein [uncultured Desulfovibrio sp.]